MTNRSRIARQRSTVNEEQESLPQQVLNYIIYPFTACIPSTSSQQDQEQRQSLLNQQSYEDSDAISLLTNIADRSGRRRNRSGRSRRERWSNSSTAIIGCGLFGRPKGQIQQRPSSSTNQQRGEGQGHSRSLSQDSAASTDGAASIDDDESGRVGSFGAAQESGDEDAGMLNDDAIANLSLSREEEGETVNDDDANAKKLEAEEAEAKAAAVIAAEALKAKEEEEAAKRKEELERRAKETARIEEENAAKQKAEEAQLAAEEEAAIAKARRKAERKAIKQGLLEAKEQGQRNTRRMTEAEAEAAAGGFDFAEEIQAEQEQRTASPDFGLEEEDAKRYNNDQYMQDGYGQEEHQTQQMQPEIVHHHHYYHEPEQEDESFHSYSIPQPPPTTYITEHNGNEELKSREEEETLAEEDEEDADIAGLGFSKTRRRTRLENVEGGSYASRSNGSGSGSRQSGRYSRERDRIGGANSNESGGRRRESRLGDGGSSTGGGSGSGKYGGYRDRPRRHERTGSRSQGSGNGKALREGPGGKIITSPTIPETDTSTIQDVSFSSATVTGESDDRADAAAGGFDDFLSPPPDSSTPIINQGNSDWSSFQYHTNSFNRSPSPNQGNKMSISPASSSSAKAGRRREMPRTQFNNSGINNNNNLNAPRNPTVGNIFEQKDRYEDEADVEGF